MSNGHGSLEMMLDTICNTFGGVLFISLLVVIILSTTHTASENTSAAAQLQLVEREVLRHRLTSQLEQLRMAVKNSHSMDDVLITPEVVELAKRVNNLQQTHSQLVQSKSEAVGQVAINQIELNELQSAIAERRARIAAGLNLAESLKKELDETVAERSRTAIIPKVTRTNLTGRTFFLKGQKLYGPRILQDGSENLVEFVYTDRNGTTQVEVNVKEGLKIQLQERNLEEIRSKLNSISPDRFFIQILVWPDSYDHFDVVQRVLEELSLKYDLQPLEEDVVIVIGPGSSPPPLVQ